MEGQLTPELAYTFKEKGFAVIQGFLTAVEVEELKAVTKQLTAECSQDMPLSVFSGIHGQQSKDKYFAESGDKIRGFLEEGSISSTGKVLVEKKDALNKMAHALHVLDPTFRKITFSDKVKAVIRCLGTMKTPTVIQSMVIFKHPQIGGEVKPHQDGSYLYSDPMERSLIGFWIALDEASKENGCLYFVPGSQKTNPLKLRFVKNPDMNSDKLFVYQGNQVERIAEDQLVPAACKPGDLVLIDGLVIHQSAPNTSNKPRMAYTFHIHDANTKWSPENWLQPTDVGSFTKLEL